MATRGTHALPLPTRPSFEIALPYKCAAIADAALALPCRYGNAVNAKRTVRGYAAAGLGGIMIEDQVAPKRCGHTKGKEVVDRATAIARVRAAVDAAREAAPTADDAIVVVARTDARAIHGLDEAIVRAQAFRDAGADICFVEAPRSAEEMRSICEAIEGPKMANMLAG